MKVGEEVEKELGRSHSIDATKTALIKRGFLETDIDEALRAIVKGNTSEKHKNNRILSAKELIDRIGYGFGSQQFVNILFMLSGASLFLIGFVNILKAFLNNMLAGILREYSKIKYIGKSFVSASGILYGFGFLGMAFAVVSESPFLFGLSAIIGTLGIIAHGDIFSSFSSRILRAEKRSNFLRFISYFGILITAASMLLASLLIDAFPLSGKDIVISLSGIEPMVFSVFGYLVAFELTAVMFILSGFLLSRLDEDKDQPYSASPAVLASIKSYFRESLATTSIFSKNKKVFLLMVASIILTITQIIGNSYYGLYIYMNFKGEFLKGFLNVAVIFVIALIASISGSVLTKKFAKSLGEAPMLVFGTLLIALLPATFYFNPHLYSIGLATALSVIGGAIVGVAEGLIAERLLDEEERKSYYNSLGFVSLVPILLLGTLGAIVAMGAGLDTLFIILACVLAFVVMPLFFAIVLIVDSEYRAEKRTTN